jgi:hypothetical protein
MVSRATAVAECRPTPAGRRSLARSPHVPGMASRYQALQTPTLPHAFKIRDLPNQNFCFIARERGLPRRVV